MILKCVAACLFVIVLSSSAFGQSINAKKLTRLRVSKELQERFAERLNLFIEYKISQHFDEQFDLFVSNCPKYQNCENLNREEYVNRKQDETNARGALLELKFKGVDGKLKENCASISLIPKLRNEGKNKSKYYTISSLACLQKSNWFFSFWFRPIEI